MFIKYIIVGEQSVIKITKITKKIGNKKILDDINLKIESGLNFIVGDSGAGKSTLLNLIGNLDIQSEGSVEVLSDENWCTVDTCKKYKSEHLGFIFQDANLINGLTIRENIKVAEEIAGIQKTEDEINKILQYFNLYQVADEKVEVLSGGERQRAAIARAIVKDAKILLADEPTGNLDQNNSKQVFELLKELSNDRIVIVVTHNLEMARLYGDRIITLRDGKISNDEFITKTGTTVDLSENNSTKTISKDIIRMLTFNNISRYKAKFFSIMLSVAIALAAVGIIFSMNFNVGKKTDEMNTVYYDADMITFYAYAIGEKNISSIIMGGEYAAISDDMMKNISESDLFEAVVPVSDMDYYIDDNEDSIAVKVIFLNEFFEERLMLDDVAGDFPTNENQLILGLDVAEKYYEGDAIGKTITITNDYGVSKDYEIVGVNGEKNIDGVYDTYISSEALENMRTSEMYTSIFLTVNVENASKDIFSEDASGFLCQQTEGEVVYGAAPDGTNQIAVSTEIIRDIYYSMTGEYVDFTYENVCNDSDIQSKIDEVLSEKYYISANDAYECEIVGVHSGASYEVLVCDAWAEKIMCAIPNKLECYCKNLDVAKEFEQTELASQYDYVSNYAERFETAVSNTGLWRTMFAIVLIIAAVLCVVLIHSYSKISVRGRLYEIGILNSLGMQRKDMRKVLVSEIYTLGILSGFVSIFLYLIYNLFATKMIDYYIEPIYIMLVSLGMFLGNIVICFVATQKVVEKAINLNAIDAIRARE